MLKNISKLGAESLVAERNRQGVPDFYRLAVNRTGLPFGHAAQHSEYGLVHQRAPVLDNLDIRHAAVRLHNEACDYLHAVALVPGGLIILQFRLDIFHQYVLPADKLRLHEPVFPTAGHVYCGAVARAYGMAGFAPRRPPRHGGEHPQHGIVDAVSDRIYYARPRNGAVFLDAGNVWLMRKDEARPGAEFTLNRFFDSIALGTGVGIRYDLSFLVLRLDWGIALHVPYETVKPGYYNIPKFKDGMGIHFAIGYPF